MSTTSHTQLVLIRIHTTAESSRPIRFTGVVEAVGEAVTGFAPGDEVQGTTERVFGPYVCVPQRQIQIIQEGE